MLLLGAGPRALLLQIAHPAGRGRGRRPLRLPRGPVAASGGHAPKLPDDRLRHDGRGARRDPAAQRAPSRHHRGPATRHATRSSRCGSTRRWSTRRSPSPTPGSSRSDATGAPRSMPRRGRSAGRSACPTRCCRRTSRRSTRTWRGCSRRRVRFACRRSRVSWRRPCCDRHSGRSSRSWPLVPPEAYAWTLWPSVGLLPATVRDEYGSAWGPRERLVSAWLVAGWRAWRRCCPGPSARCRRRSTADRRIAGGSDGPRPRRLRLVTTEHSTVVGSLGHRTVVAAAITARLPGIRLLTDPLDRESYRHDETAYNKAGLPGAVVFPTTTERGRRARQDRRRAAHPGRPARRGHRAVRRRGRHRGRPDDRLHAHGPDPRDRPREPRGRRPARRHQRRISRRPSRPRACSTRPIRPATSCARSAATWARTPAACAASSTARRATRCSASRSSWPTARSSGPAARTSRTSPATR